MNNFLKILLTLGLTILLALNCFSQNSTDEKLAIQYFNEKDYEKAIIYYEKLFNKSSLPQYYAKLLSCYIELEEFKNAEKLTKRQFKRNSYELGYLVDLGYVYSKAGDFNKSKDTYETAIKELTPSNDQILSLANAFLKYKESEYAIRTYQKGRKLLKGTYPFNFEMAQVYEQMGKTELMLEEYLDLLAYNGSYVQSVQNALQTSFTSDDKGAKKALLKTLLIKRIQKDASNKIFPEMLIWVYIQEKNFSGAFVQAKAMDKRYKESGKRIDALAALSSENKDYQTAIKCYQYLIAKGPDNYYYLTSKMELVNVYNDKIVGSGKYTREELLDLEKTYLSTIDELGKTASTSSLLRGLAHLQAFYLHNTDSAISLLNEILTIPRLKSHSAAKTKIELADVYLFTGEIWEASLLYSQVEKEFKHDVLGEEAKFKNARISFYTGDFGWAKTQLNVLKASTSKLIANDAMQLSILITDNIGIDTTEAPLLMFARADLLAYQNKNTEALALLDTLKQEYPAHSIMDDILYKRYQINFKQQKFEDAANNLQEIITSYSNDILADDAIYNLAVLNDYHFENKEKAAELYKKIMFDYQSSVFVVDARKRFRELRDKLKIIKIENDILEFETN